jgi:hypothetical protein
MAIDNDKLKKAEEILNRIKEAQKVVGGKPLFNIDPQKLSQSTEEMEKMSLAADALENKADAINSSFGDMKSTLQAVADEMEKGDKRASVYQRRVKQSVGSLTKIAEKLSSEEKGYGIESDKNIDKLIKKAQEQKDFAKSQANQLANEVGLVKNITGGYDKRTKAYKELTPEQKAIISLSEDEFKIADGLIAKLKARKALSEDFVKQTGALINLAGGLDKAFQKAGLPALGIAKAIEDTKKEFIETKGATNVVTGISKKLLSNLKDAASFANLSQLAFVALFKAMKDVDKASGEFAKNQGISYEDTLALRDEMNKVAITSGDILVTSQALMETQASLNQFFGTSVKFTGEMADDFAQLTKRTKMTAETQGLMALEMGKTGKTAMQLTKELNTQTFELNNQKGVQMSVKQIQDAIGKTAASLQLTFKGSSKELANQVMSARALGTTLQGVEQISKSLLDFESSIQAELEAELLLGKDINLERARAAALQGDLATVAEEVMENQSIMEAFNTKNVIAQEKAAAALGMSREDLANMVLEQQKLETVKAFGAENMNQAQEKYNKLREQGLTAEQAAAQVGDESLANQLQSASVAERFEAIMLRVQEIFIALGEPILGVVDGFINILGSAERFAQLLGVIAGIYAGIKAFNALDAIMQKRKERAKKKELAQETAIATAKSIANPLAALAGLAVATIVAGTILGSMSDGMIGSDGGMIVSGPKGSIQLDKEDSIIAGTDLTGEKSGKKERGGGARRDAALISEIQTLIGINKQILAKSSVIEMNGNQVGQEINQSERAIQ